VALGSIVQGVQEGFAAKAGTVASASPGGVLHLNAGQEWLVDAMGCLPERLRDASALSALFEALVVSLQLRVVGTPQWHTFPGAGGITGVALLSESHLAIHTFPETGFAALSVYSCRSHPAPAFEALAKQHLGAHQVQVRELTRGVAP